MKNTKTPLHRRSGLVCGSILPLAVSLILFSHQKAGAAVTITGSAVFNSAAGNYTYSYSVVNTGTEDLAIVTIPVFSPLGVGNTISPAGFLLTFDPSQRVVNFIEDGSILTPQTFGPGSTTGTFSFTSASAPGNVDFLAFDATGTQFSGSVVSAVPESSSAALTGIAAAALLNRRRRQS